jgi:hypothetical protein
MADPLEYLARFDVISRVEGFVSGFLNADWQGAFQRAGTAGIATELVASLTGYNAWRFYVPRNCGWNGIAIERLLKRHGVKIWDRGFTHDYLTFCVKRRQANWAEYLLRRRGIPVWSLQFNPLNDEYARRHAPGSEPSAGKRRSRPRRGFWDFIFSLLE